MSTPIQRIEVFQDTMDWVNSDIDMADFIDKAKQLVAIIMWHPLGMTKIITKEVQVI